MINRFILSAFSVLSILGLVSCSSNSAKTIPSDYPEWITSPMQGCREGEEFCASSEGRDLISADANARKALALIFETKISGEMQNLKRDEQTTDEGVLLGRSREFTSQEIKEVVDETLNGAIIDKRFIKDGSYFSLAKLDRISNAKKLKSELDEIDQKIQTLYRPRKRSKIKELLTLLEKRNKVHVRYAFVRGNNFPSPITWEQIMALRTEDKTPPKMVGLVIRSEQESGIVSLLSKEVTARFLQIETDPTKGFDYKIMVELLPKQEFIKVEGFVRYTFNLRLQNFSSSGKKIGQISKSWTENGRTKENILEKLTPQIEEYIQTHFDELKLED